MSIFGFPCRKTPETDRANLTAGGEVCLCEMVASIFGLHDSKYPSLQNLSLLHPTELCQGN